MNASNVMSTESNFSYSTWTDATDAGSNPVENKIRRDWLSKVLFDQLDGFEPRNDSDEWEYLDHYADPLFTDCLALSQESPLASIVAGRFKVQRDAGWAVNALAFGNVFNDARTTLAIKFAQWLKDQPSCGDVLKGQLLDIYCNASNTETATTLLRQTTIEIKFP